MKERIQPTTEQRGHEIGCYQNWLVSRTLRESWTEFHAVEGLGRSSTLLGRTDADYK